VEIDEHCRALALRMSRGTLREANGLRRPEIGPIAETIRVGKSKLKSGYFMKGRWRPLRIDNLGLFPGLRYTL